MGSEGFHISEILREPQNSEIPWDKCPQAHFTDGQVSPSIMDGNEHKAAEL